MTKILRMSLAAALGAIGLAGCDTASPPGAAIPETAEHASSAAGDNLARVFRDEDPYARARALGALLPTLGAEAAPDVERALRDPTLELGAVEHELLIRFWASHEPEKATRWAADWSPTFYRSAAMMAALPRWVEVDLQKALVAVRWWQRWRPDVHEAASRGLVLGWYQAGHPGLTQYLQDLGGSDLAGQIALSTYLRTAIAREGSQAVVGWAESLPSDGAGYKQTVYRQVASALALLDHAAAMRWCEAYCDSPFGTNLRKLIAARWVMHDGPGAFAWLSTAPEGHDKNLAIRATFADWGTRDPEAALAWMAEQTADGEAPVWLEPVFPVYAGLLAEKSPATAIEWARRIDKQRERELTLIKIARSWRESDEAAADAWLEESPLSEEARAKVRDPNWRQGRRSASRS
jgi:hypothetical protein